MNRITTPLPLVLATLCLTGCTLCFQPTQGIEPPPSPSPQQLYLQSLGEIIESGPSPSLETLRESFPQSPWTQKADQLSGLLDSHRQLLRENRRLKESLSRCRQKGTEAREQIEQQHDDLQRMKELVIEMEIRSRESVR